MSAAVAPAVRWNPRDLFLSVIHQTMLGISSGLDWHESARLGAAQFMRHSENPGLNVHCEPFTLASDFASIIKTYVAGVHACVEPFLKPISNLTSPKGHPCVLEALSGQDGRVHLWQTVGRLSDATMWRAIQRPDVMDVLKATKRPAIVHFVEIGSQQGSHQVCSWSRIWTDPVTAGRFSFHKQMGSRPVFFAECPKNSPEEWVRMMQRDHVIALYDVKLKAVTE